MYTKYPRTAHLPWSPGATSDDKWVDTLAMFEGQEIVITEKMDGENTTMYSDHIHARSIDSRHHASRSWVKSLHHRVAHLIPPGWRVCGENMYARHSLGYEALPSYFLMFSIWDESGRCLDWRETQEWSELLGLELVPVWYRGEWDEAHVRSIEVDLSTQEGYVVRTAAGFELEEFGCKVAKWVRAGHVQTETHWMYAEIVPNGLMEEE